MALNAIAALRVVTVAHGQGMWSMQLRFALYLAGTLPGGLVTALKRRSQINDAGQGFRVRATAAM